MIVFVRACVRMPVPVRVCILTYTFARITQNSCGMDLSDVLNPPLLNVASPVCAVPYRTVLYSTVPYCTVPYCTVILVPTQKLSQWKFKVSAKSAVVRTLTGSGVAVAVARKAAACI